MNRGLLISQMCRAHVARGKAWACVAGLLVATIGLESVHAETAFHIYGASRETKRLWVVEARETGGPQPSLTLEVQEKVDLDFGGGTIARHPEKPVLYLAGPLAASGEGDKEIFSGAEIVLDAEGGIEALKARTFPSGYAYLSVDRAARFLLGASYRSGRVDVFSLGGDGAIGDRVGGRDEGRTFAHAILVSPDNRFVYVPYVKANNGLFQYRFDPETGTMAPLDPLQAEPPEGTGPRHVAYHPTLPLVYFSNEQHIGASVYAQDDEGRLTIRQVCDAVPADLSKEGLSASDIAITPDGAFLFTGLRGARRNYDHIVRYRIEEDGRLTLLGLTPADAVPWGFTLSPDGRYLLVTASSGATLSAYAILEDGALERRAVLEWDEGIRDLVAR